MNSYYSNNIFLYDNKNENKNKKLKKNDFYTYNEISISKLLKNIKEYYFYFLPIVSYEDINLNISKLKYDPKTNISYSSEIIKNKYTIKNEYIMIELSNFKRDKFMDYLYKLSLEDNKNLLISSIIDTFKYLLYSIEKLLLKDLIHFNLTESNIIYNLDYNIPIIMNFNNSFSIKRINENIYDKIFNDILLKNNVYPFEAFIIYYLIKNNCKTLNNDDINNIIIEYFESNIISKLLSLTLKIKFEKKCRNELNKLILHSKNKIISILLKNHRSWDLYAISILYLQLIDNFFSKDKPRIIISLLHILIHNLSPDPNDRYDIYDTQDKISQAIISEGLYIEENNLLKK